ncbi:thiol:disulfide interchange protein DsbD [Herbaspirillum sp. Sphag1AN]|uniref:protein-disulfide reductase DsbD n=1 Tax=unclassified Herbaspirillum TaxID=2624150 RepID=UPI00160A0031|nr:MULTISPECIES: protein-disulfide reductase DsbD [unclassified Herbaspirillum]MBB3214743.1 thiol:disulfide interchange protein DsbD [Herbaspirillum sp. Sphag1AN]MBB3247939.1 thiol:disulfide interchange protein DsbD [Herbaspirillum sp. Sphag64]
MCNRLYALVVRCLLSLVFLPGVMLLPLFAHAENYLAPEAAFQFSAQMIDAKTVVVTYRIADGYHMYREQFRFRAQGATLGTPEIPAGEVKFDANFGKNVETYRHSVQVLLPVTTAGKFTLTSTGQGCADKGLCYPPMDSVVSLSPAMIGQELGPGAQPLQQTNNEAETITATLKGGKLLPVLSLFLLLGLGLSLTPCVLPMLPILSSIIVGDGAQSSRGRGFLLSLNYSFGMALVYTALGVAAGLLGEGLSATLQNPWVLGAFALLMAALSLSMFDVYTLQLPSALQSRLTNASGKQAGGKLLGVFLMGAISALIVGPCVAAPLAGALLYISQTRDIVLGGAALFAMAAGMSVPLLLLGLSAGTLLPRAGMWMDGIKRFFGVLMLATAWWMVSPVLPAWLNVTGWAALGIGYGAFLLWGAAGGWLVRALGLVVATLGLLQLVNVSTGGRDALSPLSHLVAQPATRQGASAETKFVRVKSIAELDVALAQTAGKPALLDFYADWCVSCKEMERYTFSDPAVKEKLAQLVLLQIDVTANNADDKAMLKRFQLFGPPGIILFDRQGRELADKRIIGFQNAEQFLQSLLPLTTS